jgi:2-amino-4-hydroxy-6-hydroxymethyldihydropteridine diphosphokinase
MAQVYVSIGSNRERKRNINLCLQALRERFGFLRISTVYRSKAVGFDGDDFFNLVVGFNTPLAVHQVAASLRDIEAARGRRRNHRAKFSPRPLDLDLLLYDDLVLNEAGLQIPREDISRYAFVLRPLVEIAGNRRHPVLNCTFAELWKDFTQGNEQLWPVALDVETTGYPKRPACG